MAHHNKRQLYPSVPPDVYSDERAKFAGRDQLRKLKTIKEREAVEMTADLGKQKLARQGSTELTSTSPYAAASRYPLFRSKSVSKLKSKAGRQSSLEKERPGKVGNFHTRTASFSLAKGLQASMRLAKPVLKAPVLSHSFSFKDGPKEDNLNLSFLTLGPDSPHLTKDSPLLSDLKNISDRLEKGLKDVEARGEADWRAEMRVCSKAFTEVIGLGATLGMVLDRIKGKYELWIGQLGERHAKEVGRLKGEVAAMHQSLVKEMEEKKAFKRKFEKISRESIELSRSCDNYQNKCFEYQEKLCEIANVSLEGFPPTESAWRLLLSELETYKVWRENAEKELKSAQQKERKLLQLLHAIKKRGFPVEEVYHAEVRKSSKVVSSSRGDTEESEDTEPIAVGPPLVRKRPDQVPILKIEAVEVEASSVSESFSLSSTLNDWQNTSIYPDPDSKRDTLLPPGKYKEGSSHVSLQSKYRPAKPVSKS